MTATFMPTRRADAGKQPPSVRLAPGRRRRPALLAGSLVSLTACSALFASAYTKAGHQTPVLGVARAVAAGATISPHDLTVVRIAASGHLAPISSTEARQVVGRRAAVALVAGTLLTSSQLSDAPVIPAGAAIVGVSAKPGQIPAEGVFSGEAVDVVLTGAPGASALSAVAGLSGASSSGGGDAAAPLPSLSGIVIAPHVLVTGSASGTAAAGGATEISLLVPSALAPVIASASAAGQIALVAVPSVR